MRRTLIFALVLTLAVAAQAIAADGGKAKNNGGFWDGLKGKLQKIIPAQRARATTAAGRVLGAGQDDVDVLYWKGKEDPVVLAEDELAAFSLAFGMVLDGKRDEAVAAFESFIEHYPESSLAEDAKAALEALKSPE